MEIQEKDFEELEMIRESYYELIMAVENKYPNENRHQTALRLIREAQQPSKPANTADAKCQHPLDNMVGESPNYFCGICGAPMRR